MSSINGLSSSGLNFSGLSTGIDTTRIIDGLTSINSKRISQFQEEKQQVTQQQSVFAGVEGKLLDFQTQVGRLSRSVAGVFDARNTTSSDDTLVTGVASSTAQLGNYNLTVNRLAQGEKVATATFASATETIKTGNVELRVGGGETMTITIDSTNNNVRGLVDVVNRTKGDVTASLVNDGTNVRIMLSSSKSGAANSIQVTNNLTGGSGTDFNLRDRVVQAAQDAEVTIGSGVGAITVQSASNTLENVIDGVSLSLLNADPAKTVSLSVGSDTKSAKTAIEDFVKSYNGLVEYIDDRDDYDSVTQQAGSLLGNRDIIELRNDLENIITGTVAGANPKLNRLSSLGITINETGRLSLDSGKLDQVLSGSVEGVQPTDLKQLFALTGTSNNSGVSFLLGGNKTKPSPTAGYGVNISSAATQASIRGSAALVGVLSITSANNTFAVRVNNLTSALLAVDPGTYTPAQLSSAIQSLLTANFTGSNQVNVDLNADFLRLTTSLYGSSASVGFTDGTLLPVLGFDNTSRGAGTDVAGNFVVNGETETAIGTGQVLMGSANNANTDGLQVRVTLNESEVNSGVEATMNVTQGLAASLFQVMEKYTDPVAGRFETIDKRLQDNLKSIDDNIKKQNELLDQKKNSLLLQFSAMESAVNKIKTAGNSLSSLVPSTNR